MEITLLEPLDPAFSVKGVHKYLPSFFVFALAGLTWAFVSGNQNSPTKQLCQSLTPAIKDLLPTF